MKIEINTIVTLNNNEQYLILNETTYEGNHYYLVMGLDSNKEPDAKKVAIFEEIVENNEVYLDKIEDSELIITLTKLLKSQL